MENYRASSLFQPSNLAEAVKSTINDSGECTKHLYGSIMSFPHTVVARTVSVLGFDFIMIDSLHTAIDPENLVQLVQTINFTSEGKTVAVVRVPSSSSPLLAYALDAGAAGIVFPHIDTPEEAAEAVRKCRYTSSGGERSLSPSALLAGITDLAPGSSHVHIADKNIAVICQIESSLSVQNAEKIAAVPGVNVLMVGTGDLRLSLGLSKPVAGQEDPIFINAMNQIIQVSKKFKMPLMACAFGASSESNLLRNFGLLLSSADILTIRAKQQSDLEQLKEAMKNSESHQNINVNGEHV